MKFLNISFILIEKCQDLCLLRKEDIEKAIKGTEDTNELEKRY